MAPNPPGFPSDTLPVPQIGARATPSEDQQQGFKLQELLTRFATRRGARPFLAGSVLGSAGLYAVQVLLGGPIGDFIGLPGISMGGLVAVGAFAGSVVVGGTFKVAGIISNSPTLLYYARSIQAWLLYRLGRISPKRYYEYCAVLDYEWLYGHVSPDARPQQAAFVREMIQRRRGAERMKRAGKTLMGTGGNLVPSGAGKSPAKTSTKTPGH